MKQTIKLIMYLNSSEESRYLYDLIEKDIPTELKKDYPYIEDDKLTIELKEDAESHHIIKTYAEENGISYSQFKITHYTKKEIESSEFYQLYLMTDVLELEGKNAKDYGSEYRGGCKLCGLGETLVGDLLVDRKFMRKKSIGVLAPEYFVSQEVKDLLEGSGLTGFSFDHKIKDYKGREMADFYTLDVKNILPPMSETTWLETYKESFYDECGHHFVYLRSDLEYAGESMEHAKDFNLAQERTNNNRMREIVISARAREFFRKNRLYVRFTPVILK